MRRFQRELRSDLYRNADEKHRQQVIAMKVCHREFSCVAFRSRSEKRLKSYEHDVNRVQRELRSDLYRNGDETHSHQVAAKKVSQHGAKVPQIEQ